MFWKSCAYTTDDTQHSTRGTPRKRHVPGPLQGVCQTSSCTISSENWTPSMSNVPICMINTTSVRQKTPIWVLLGHGQHDHFLLSPMLIFLSAPPSLLGYNRGPSDLNYCLINLLSTTATKSTKYRIPVSYAPNLPVTLTSFGMWASVLLMAYITF